LYIQQEDVGFKVQRLRDSLIAVPCLSHNLEGWIVLQHVADAEADHRVIIGYDDANACISVGPVGRILSGLLHSSVLLAF
jgi:hypothetical protein